MDAAFKSPRPPAPRRRSRSRGQSISRNLAHALDEDDHDGQVPELDQRGRASEDTAEAGGRLTVDAVLQELGARLAAKSNEIQLAGRLGEALLSQQAELEAQIRGLEDELRASDGRQHARHFSESSSDEEGTDVVSAEVREKLHALERQLQLWDRGNEEMYRIVGSAANSDTRSAPIVVAPVSSEAWLRTADLCLDRLLRRLERPGVDTPAG